MNIEEAIAEFVVAGQADGWSPATVKQYEWHLGRLAAFLANQAVTDVSQLSRTLMRRWAGGIRNQWEPATCKVAVTVARSWLSFCNEEGYDGASDLLSVLKAPRVPERVQRTLDSYEVERLLAVCDEPATAGLTPVQAEAARLRNAAIVSTLFDTIIRASELCRLDLTDLYADRMCVAVRRKGGNEALVRYSERTGEYLAAWLAVRTGMAAAGCCALFTAITGNTPGQRLTTNGLRIVVRRLGERAGVADVSPHAFRRGGTVAAIENGAPDRMIQLHGGWSKTNMIQTYSRTLRADERFDAYLPMRAVNGVKSPLAR